MASKVPLVDLSAQYRSLHSELEKAVSQVLAGTRYILGPEVDAFEREFAAACGAPHAIGVANGTDALAIALQALGVGPGDDVVTVPNTFIATQEAITRAGARCVFADVDPRTATIAPEALERALTKHTRAVIPVHLYGHPADMDAVLSIAQAKGLKVLEDAAQAHGARYRGRPVGSMGDAAGFSFYPGKNLGAAGDAGAVVCRDGAVASRVRRLRNHGRTQKYLHEEEGSNSRLDELQAAVLRVKLPRLAGWNARRRELAARYREKLGGRFPVLAPAEWAEPVYHLFVVEVEDRDAVLARLQASGIEAGVHYPVPLHLQPAGRYLGYEKGDFPVAERMSARVLSLPLYPEMTEAQQDAVIAALTAGQSR